MRLTVSFPALGAVLLLASPMALAEGALPSRALPSRAETAKDGDDARVVVELVVDKEAVAPGGSFRAGVLFTLDEGWHVYWKEPGDGAYATRVSLAAAGADVGELLWPAPEVFSQSGGEILTHGYAGSVLLSAPVRLGPVQASATTTDRIDVTADVSFLVCDVDCVPGEARLGRTVAVVEAAGGGNGKGEVLAPADVRARFALAEARAPADPDGVGVVVRARFDERSAGRARGFLDVITCDREGEHTCASASVREPRPVLLEPGAPFTVLSQTAAPHPDAHRGVRIALELMTADGSEVQGRLTGLVRLVVDGKDSPIALDVDVGAPPKVAAAASSPGPILPALNTSKVAAPPSATGGELGLAYVLLLAFLGGLVLNLMPCVFPVLALKVFGLMQAAHESRAHRLAHAGAYTAGIVGSMLGLASVVLGLKVFGTQVGWGFQFQSPGFLVFMCAVLVVFAMSFFDVFTVGVVGASFQGSVDQAQGLRRSAGEGALAVALSTPCSAPFLGTAVGFALAAGGVTVVLVFIAIGLGLATPFIILSQAPGVGKLLPRPGPWMVHSRVVLGFSLLFTVVWMLWVLGRVVGIDGVAAVMVFLMSLGLFAWVYGLVQRVGLRPARIALVPLTALAVGAGVYVAPEPEPVVVAAPGGGPIKPATSGPIEWQPWSPEAVKATLAQGTPVFVDFTADWCITCKANEKGIITQEAVVAHMRERGVVPMKADWTRPDERIRLALEEHGKAGVPMYLVYSPKEERPRVLPEVLTAGILTDAFDWAGR